MGAEIPADRWEYRFVADVIEAVERRIGVPTRWNGRLWEETNEIFLASSLDDGTMTVEVAKVLEPVKLAYTADRPLTADEIDQARLGAQLQKFFDGPAAGSQTVQAKADTAHRQHERSERGSARG